MISHSQHYRKYETILLNIIYFKKLNWYIDGHEIQSEMDVVQTEETMFIV